jgi:hypothetical protein
MSRADHLWQSYTRRMGISSTAYRDGAYNYSLNMLRDLLRRLEVILEDENVAPETAARILRCLLYGAPSAADAEERIHMQEEIVKAMQQTPLFLSRKTP